MQHEITDFGLAEYLGNGATIAQYGPDALATQAPAFVADAIAEATGIVAHAVSSTV